MSEASDLQAAQHKGQIQAHLIANSGPSIPSFFAGGCHCCHTLRVSERPDTLMWQDVFIGATTLVTRGSPKVIPPASWAGLCGPSSASPGVRVGQAVLCCSQSVKCRV